MHFLTHHLDEISSTNHYALELIQKGQAQHYLMITANSQTQGRGRQDRDWQSPVGNFYGSLVLQDVQTDRLTDYSFLTACVIGELLRFFGVNTQYKWPNDMMLEGKKLAGILLQSQRLNQVDYLVIGVGVNIVSCPDYAISLRDVAVQIDKESFLQKFEEIFMRLNTQYQQFGFEVILRQWKEHAFKIGQHVQLSSGLQGIFDDVDSQGNIILIDENGQKHVSAVVEIL